MMEVEMPYQPIEERRMYQRAEWLADAVWEIVAAWPWLATKTVGVQWIRATDSIGANIAEAGGRFHPGEVRQFLYYARGSLRESKYWHRRAARRALVTPARTAELDVAIERLSSEINRSIHRQRERRVVREPAGTYRLTRPHDLTTSPPHHLPS